MTASKTTSSPKQNLPSTEPPSQASAPAPKPPPPSQSSSSPPPQSQSPQAQEAPPHQPSLQLTIWVYQTENSGLTIHEKLEKDRWEFGRETRAARL